jgi:hypothetical protein
MSSPRQVRAIAIALLVVFTQLANFSNVVNADDGARGKIVTIYSKSTTHLQGARTGSKGGVTPFDSTNTDLGGVTATSISGLQYQEGVFLVDVQG